ncbi:hypothetical protein S225a_19920 [Candidatus Brocadiaceae bacterium S225]|nr:hypothetical protein S225a_19920 [Candidatus Brocadiaceae bacterium S225]
MKKIAATVHLLTMYTCLIKLTKGQNHVNNYLENDHGLRIQPFAHL